jgi:GH25 family lysozyme M1 (1,4-beta-N-acetylmuramidase)
MQDTVQDTVPITPGGFVLALTCTTANVYRLLDDPPTWVERRDKCVSVLNSTKPDLIFVQECTETQEAYLLTHLDGDWGSAVDQVNTGVLYRRDKFTLISVHPFTLDGVDDGRKRYAAGVVLEADGVRFCAVSPHLASSGDTKAPEARLKQTQQILDELEVWDVLELPTILAGDWNDKTETGIVPILKAAGFVDVRSQTRTAGSAIDRFFVNSQVTATSLVKVPAGIASDHDFERAELTLNPTEAPLRGVDVSSWQAGWTPDDGDTFVFVKATQGTTYANPERAAQLAAAREAGLVTGHYHWLEPGNPSGQAAHFLEHADIIDGELLWVDWEGDWDNGTHPSVADAAAFIAVVKLLRPDNRVGLYCNRSDWTTTTVKAGDCLWIAEYGVAKPNITATWDFWQYSRTPIDQNRSRFTNVEALQAWANDVPALPAPPPTGPVIKHSTKWDVDYQTWKGQGWVTVKDHAILTAIEAEVRPWWGTLNLSQGGLSTAVAASAGTHTGLGAFDVRTADKPKAAVWKLASVFLRCGMVFFPRGYIADSFQNAKHGHVVSRESYYSLHPSAQAQYKEYRDGGDGLVGSRTYTGPDTDFERWSGSALNPLNITGDTAAYRVTASELLGLNVDRERVTSKKKDETVTAVKQVYRWDRPNIVTAEGVFFARDYLEPVLPPIG